MKHLKNFQSHNEDLFGMFKNPIKSPVKYRQDIPVSKRMRENNIKQIFDKNPDTKKEILTKSYLVHDDDKVASLEINSTNDYGDPLITITIFDKDNIEKKIKSKVFYNQEKAIHFFLDYWESQTEEGREKNKAFRLKKY